MITWLSLDRLIAPPPSPRWVIPGLQIGPGRASMLYGKRGTAKSLVAWSAAVAVAGGFPVWGSFRIPRAMTAAIVDLELGEATTRRRVHACARGLGLDLRAIADRLRVVSYPSPEILMKTDALCAAFEGVDLAIIDTLGGAIRGRVDENDTRIRAWIDPMSEASNRIGTAFLFIHHEGTTFGKSRGSTAIEDAAGAVFRLSGQEDGKPRRLVQTKVAADACGLLPPVDLMVEKTADDGAKVTVKGASETPTDRRAAQVIPLLVRTLQGWTRPLPPTKGELFDAVGGNRTAVFEAIDRAADAGLVRVEAAGKSKRVVLTDTRTTQSAAE